MKERGVGKLGKWRKSRVGEGKAGEGRENGRMEGRRGSVMGRMGLPSFSSDPPVGLTLASPLTHGNETSAAWRFLPGWGPLTTHRVMVSGESCVPAAESEPIASRVKYNQPAIKDDVKYCSRYIMLSYFLLRVHGLFSSTAFSNISESFCVQNCIELNCIE